MRRLPVRGRAIPRRPVVVAGACIGFGLACILDGVVLADAARWHAISSDRVYGLLGLALALTGVIRLWDMGQPRAPGRLGRLFYGAALCAWGGFQVLDMVLGYYDGGGPGHPAPSLPTTVYDLAYLATGVILLLAGYLLARSGRSSMMV
ncbi:MAG TPA: DUF2243 domain-containing protein [Steroidobacteraceae bacterium]